MYINDLSHQNLQEDGAGEYEVSLDFTTNRELDGEHRVEITNAKGTTAFNFKWITKPDPSTTSTTTTTTTQATQSKQSTSTTEEKAEIFTNTQSDPASGAVSKSQTLSAIFLLVLVVLIR